MTRTFTILVTCCAMQVSTLSAAEPEYAWEAVNLKADFAPRDGAGLLGHHGKLWLLGGWNPGDRTHFPRVCNNEVWSSADGKAWKLEQPNTWGTPAFDPQRHWEGRHTAGYVVHRDRMWIVGGDANQGHYQSDVWNSADGTHWSRVGKEPVAWGPRVMHYTVAFRDRIWVIGGQTLPHFAESTDAFYRDVWNSADGLTWTKIEPKEPAWTARGLIGGGAVLRDRIWLIGGGRYDTPKHPARAFYNDVWSTEDGIHWTIHTQSAPWSPRQYHETIAFDGRLWVLEGWNAQNRNDVWHSADGVNWTELKNTPWAPRHAASVVVHDSSLWLVAGNNMTSDVWRLVRKH